MGKIHILSEHEAALTPYPRLLNRVKRFGREWFGQHPDEEQVDFGCLIFRPSNLQIFEDIYERLSHPDYYEHPEKYPPKFHPRLEHLPDLGLFKDYPAKPPRGRRPTFYL